MPKVQKIRLYGLSCDIGEPPERWRLTLRGNPVFRWNTRAPPASWRLTLRVNSWKNRLCTVHGGAHFAAFAANPPFFSCVLDAKNLLRIDFAKYFASCGARRGLCPSTPAARRQSPALKGSRALREKGGRKLFLMLYTVAITPWSWAWAVYR